MLYLGVKLDMARLLQLFLTNPHGCYKLCMTFPRDVQLFTQGLLSFCSWPSSEHCIFCVKHKVKLVREAPVCSTLACSLCWFFLQVHCRISKRSKCESQMQTGVEIILGNLWREHCRMVFEKKQTELPPSSCLSLHSRPFRM